MYAFNLTLNSLQYIFSPLTLTPFSPSATGRAREDQDPPRAESQDGGCALGPVCCVHALRSSLTTGTSAEGNHVQVKT